MSSAKLVKAWAIVMCFIVSAFTAALLIFGFSRAQDAKLTADRIMHKTGLATLLTLRSAKQSDSFTGFPTTTFTANARESATLPNISSLLRTRFPTWTIKVNSRECEVSQGDLHISVIALSNSVFEINACL